MPRTHDPSLSRRQVLKLAGAAVGATAVGCAATDDSDPDSGLGADATVSVDDAGPTPDAGAPSDATLTDALAPDAADVPDAMVSDAMPMDTGEMCVLAPEQIEGPFFADLMLMRRDITEGRPGAPLEVEFTVVDAANCAPIEDALVDLWHADATGLYSAFERQGDNQDIDTTGESFLRGLQRTDASGLARFSTLYPGWYPGRTTHFHFKVHFSDQTYVTSQLYFPDAVSDAVYLLPAYAARGGKDTTNAQDRNGGREARLLMDVVETVAGSYRATFTIGIDRS